jgi:DNA-binding MarR family transcriptional regulator
MARSGESDTVREAAQRIARECIALRVRRLSRSVTRIFDEALRPHGLTTAQLNMLVAITLAGRIRPSELARALDLEKSTVTRNLERMRANRWVRAEPEPERNGYAVAVQPVGRALLERALPAWASAQVRAKRQVGESLASAVARMKGGERVS